MLTKGTSISCTASPNTRRLHQAVPQCSAPVIASSRDMCRLLSTVLQLCLLTCSPAGAQDLRPAHQSRPCDAYLINELSRRRAIAVARWDCS